MDPNSYSVKDFEWQEKCWGRTKLQVLSSGFQRHTLEVKEGTYCSFHYHNVRHNRFIVISGAIRVIWSVGWKLESHILVATHKLSVPCGIAHQFQVLDSGEVIEEYFHPDKSVAICTDDIVRLTVGGKSDIVCDLDFKSIVNEDGRIWEGGPNWTTPQCLASTERPSISLH